jgi:hypothetical protein
MRASPKVKTTFVIAAVLSLIGAVAFAQNLEVKGNAWFATGGSGSAGIGTNTPLAKFHVVAPGGFGGENTTDGKSLAGNVPVVAQGSSTVFGILNSNGRQVGAINVDGDGATATSRGYINFNDKADGSWHQSLVLNKGNVGIGATQPSYRLDVTGDMHSTGWVRTDGSAGWYSQTYDGGWFMQDPTWIRTYRSKSVWTDTGLLGSNGGLSVGYGGSTPPSAGAAIAGNVGIGTTAPIQKLDVKGGISAGNSDIYFTNPNHSHTGFGNTGGYAAIENASNYGTLMILGRSGTPNGRRVDVWDYLQVNGSIRATNGTLVYNDACTGALTSSSTCSACQGCQSGDSWYSCCYYYSVNNTLVGRLMDP